MPQYKLTYFNGRGRAECCRLVFALAGVPFQDERLDSDQWKSMKPNSKFGLLPQLEFNGKLYTQSRAIMVFLGREFGFYPSNNEQALQVDEVIGIMEDMFKEAIKAFFAKEDEKEKLNKEYMETHFPKFCDWLEKLLKANNDGKGFFVGDKITVADVAVYDFLSSSIQKMPGCVDRFPLLKSLVERVGAIDKIQKWVKTRPVTAM